MKYFDNVIHKSGRDIHLSDKARFSGVRILPACESEGVRVSLYSINRSVYGALFPVCASSQGLLLMLVSRNVCAGVFYVCV